MLGGATVASANPTILFLGEGALTASLAPALRSRYTVTVTATSATAKQLLRRAPFALVIVDIDADSDRGVDVCAEAKSLELPPAVLATTTNTDKVPDVLAAGCDAILLKPFAPNLFYARIGRLLRARSQELLAGARRSVSKSHHLTERSALHHAGTNQIWPNTYCPYCAHEGVTSFEFAAYRRAWYACLSCRQVWLAKLEE